MGQNWELTSLNLKYAKFYNYVSFVDMIIIKIKELCGCAKDDAVLEFNCNFARTKTVTRIIIEIKAKKEEEKTSCGEP